MKIAIVTPHPVPLALGGAENLWWGLQDHFNQQTDHRCDIVSVMAPEGTFWDLVGSYETFSKLDLSAYDCVISGKYPAWMVEHPYHVCYMLHRLRGLYDTYGGAPDDTAALLGQTQLRDLVEWMAEGGRDPDPACIPELFERLGVLRGRDLPDTVFAFPGPFSRAVIHFLDNAALSPRRIKRYAAISATVARRKTYFPEGVEVGVLYPPPHRDNYHCRSSRYFFTSSRLDGPKRIGLIIEAMRHVPDDIPLLIAGTGPEEARLKALAGQDSRIRFLGYVHDDAMPDLYADALAVPFVPADEDYGLVTIEAMKSGKPVLTVPDSGGPVEFVRDGETGLVSSLSPAAIGEGLARLAGNIPATEAMGRAARETVSTITWDRVAEGLLQLPSPSVRKIMRPKLTVATTFRVYPPMNGGQARVFHLYRNLARVFDMDIVSLGPLSSGRSEVEIAPGMIEITIPMTEAHAEAEYHVSRQAGNLPVSDVAANALLGLTPAYQEALELSALTSMNVVASQPYMIDILKRAAPGKPFWYEAQNVELTLKKDVFGKVPEAHSLLEEVRRAERECWLTAERVFACTRRDLEELERIYGPTLARRHEVPNGVSLENTPFTDLAERRRLQKAAGIDNRQVATFIGSWHGPNLEAVEDILELASQRPMTRFIIMGSVCQPFKDRTLPANVDMLGTVDMETRDLILSIADVALNPMRLGSGTNLKMLDYMAAGIPVLSTSFGARGLTIQPDKHFILAEKSDLAAALARIDAMAEADLAAIIQDARQAVTAIYSWEVIADNFLAELQSDTDYGRLLARS